MSNKLLTVLGVVFVLVGLVGFFNHPVFGLFEVDTMHNIVHLLSGILAVIVASKGEGPSRRFAKVFGAAYLVVAIIGFIQGNTVLGIISINAADNYLHTLLAIILLAVGFAGNKTPIPRV